VLRSGWDDAFAEMAAAGDDAPLLPDGPGPVAADAPWQW